VLEAKSSASKRSVRRFYIRLVLVLISFLSALTSPASSQTAPGVRKVVYKVAPKYPRELRQNEIGGIVRLSVVINPNGSVSKVTPVGGNPVLLDAATQAVKQWKYAPSDHPTTAEVQLDFIPRQQ
jgi:TonB family protein